MYGSWDMEHDWQSFLSFWTVFFPTNNPQNQTLEKIKKTGDIIILQICTINDNHMMYESSDMERDGQNLLPFYPLTTQKTKILKKWKNTRRYYSFYTRVP